MKHLARTLALAPALVAAAAGAAQAHGPDSIFEPLTMDHHTPESTLNVDFAYVKYDEPTGVDATAIGFSVSGQYVTPRGLGAYLTIPMSYLDYTATAGPFVLDDSTLALGNLELGGIFAKYLRPHAAIVLHAGFALPTAGDEDLDALQALASSPRYGNLVQRVPNSTWFRLGGALTGRTGKLFWRADAGLDLALDEDEATEISPVFRFNVGGGFDFGTAHLLAELVTNWVTTEAEDDDESATTFALGARFVSGNLRPGIAVLLPIGFGDSIAGELEFTLAVSIAARL